MTTDRPTDPPTDEPVREADVPSDAAAPSGRGTGERSKRSAAAETLAAAVRAVESGERSAASFFTEQSRPSGQGAGSGTTRAGAVPAGAVSTDAVSAGSLPASSVPTGSAPAGFVPAPAAPAARADGPVGPAALHREPPAPHSAPTAPPAPVRVGLAGLPAAQRLAQSATVREVLGAGGAPEALADKVLDVLGERAATALREDPWQLLAVPGVRPEQADGFARALLGPDCGPGDERRAQALVHWVLERAALEGHTALEPSTMTAALARRSVPDPEEALGAAVADGGVLMFQDVAETPGSAPARTTSGADEDEEPPVRVLLGLDRYALAEESLADGLARLLNTFAPEDGSASSRPTDVDAADAEGRPARAGDGSAPGPAGAAPEGPGADSQEPGSAPGEPSGRPDRAAPSLADWEVVAEAAPSPSAADVIRAVAGSGLVAHTGGEAARAEPAAVVAAARALGLRAYAAAYTADGRARLAELIAAAGPLAPGGGRETTPPGRATATATPNRTAPTNAPATATSTNPATPTTGPAAVPDPNPTGPTNAPDAGAPTNPTAPTTDPAPGPNPTAPTTDPAPGPNPTAPTTDPAATASTGPVAPTTDPATAASADPAGALAGAPAAPVGTGPAALTVAGLLSGTEGPGRDEDGAFALDLLVVVDAPQLDVETAALLVESLPDGARLMLSGDPSVLWSAGAGRVFADLLATRMCPQVASRTPDPGPIGELVSGIGIGELSQVAAPGKEVVIVPVRDAGEAVHRTVQLVADSVPRAIGVAPEHTQVITPGHGGAAGTRALNAALKERLNPGPGRFGGFDPGDRVAYVPAPGRVVPGTVVSADAEGLRLDCSGSPVVVPPDRVGETVRHARPRARHLAVGDLLPHGLRPGLGRGVGRRAG
ncbi:helix-hairpin-helix domain-containing protein, partial [Streptomyces pathocidini]|uniref:helix-hairpin-helix domain-containing protein n=1 Tax=Streptomyces pathocidini TaxID=1650571 RepID=UPI0033F4DEE5